MTLKDRAHGLLTPRIRRKSLRTAPAPAADQVLQETQQVQCQPDIVHVQPDPRPGRDQDSYFTKPETTPKISTPKRYTISAAAEGSDVFQQDPDLHTTPASAERQKETSHMQQPMDKSLPPTSPVSNLSTRLRRVMKLESLDRRHIRTTSFQESPALLDGREQSISVEKPTQVVRPDSGSLAKVRKDPEYQQGTAQSDLPSRGIKAAVPEDRNHLTAVLSDDPTRPHSRGSSQSSKDRSHPPPSFPSNFYTRFPEHRESAIPPSSLEQGSMPGQVHNSSSTRTYTILSTPTTELASPPPPRIPSTNSYRHVETPRSTPLSPPIELAEPLMQETRAATHSVDPPRETPHRRTRSHSPTSSLTHSRARGPSDNLRFHELIHYYTACSHSSPPASRPLNVQPQIEVVSHTGDEDKNSVRSTIIGSCFDCDTALRRDEETRILIYYNSEIGRLEADIDRLEQAEGAPVSPIAPHLERPRTPVGRSLARSHAEEVGHADLETPSTTRGNSSGNYRSIPEDNIPAYKGSHSRSQSTAAISLLGHEDEYQSNLSISRIQSIKLRIHSMVVRRDAEVKKAWRGYTARWGPGTMGVVRRNTTDTGRQSLFQSRHLKTQSTGTSIRSRRSDASPRKDGGHPSSVRDRDDDENSGIIEKGPSTPARSIGASAHSGSARRGHARGTSRESTFSNFSNASRGTGITYELSSDTPEGRMRVDWIRQ